MSEKIIQIDSNKCTQCGICLEQFGCPSFMRLNNGEIIINRTLCNSNGSCIPVCPHKAIIRQELQEATV